MGSDQGLPINKNIVRPTQTRRTYTVLMRRMHVHKPYIIYIQTHRMRVCIHIDAIRTYVTRVSSTHCQKHTVCAENVHTIWGTAVGKMLPFFNTTNKEVVNYYYSNYLLRFKYNNTYIPPVGTGSSSSRGLKEGNHTPPAG